ncbi:sensor histidine kinase [Bariatricus sp. SGI.154]|uniref:sensor histidine kinase n=1 Tax=Bariatricus sp. SGI.154 TaxID=3420549 RepID=UPI003CFDE760
MIRRIYALLEICNVILCLHFLHGRKIRVDLPGILLVCADALIFELIHTYAVNPIMISMLYILTFVYSMVEFDRDVKRTLISNMLYVMIVGILQLMVSIPTILFPQDGLSDNLLAVYINLGVLVVQYLSRRKLHQLFELVLKKNVVIFVVTAIFCASLVQSIIQYKRYMKMSLDELLMLMTFGSMVCILSYCWQMEREKLYAKEVELKMHEVYDDSFREMIESIRERQHDFYNHIQAIRCQHYSIHNYEELVREQDAYCEMVLQDNKFYRLLSSSNPVITGFLYGKFSEADRRGIEIEYSVKILPGDREIPVFILIEILGILWDNAIEAVADIEESRVALKIEEDEDSLRIEMANPIKNISRAEIMRFFENGYSSKEGHMGLGLGKLQKYSRKYGFDLLVDKENRDKSEWLIIGVMITKSRHS